MSKKIWALGDPHLAMGDAGKDMGIFGPAWQGYMDKISARWQECVSAEDLVLLPGDISWAMRLEQALVDLWWIDALPGTKVIIRGNHDYWWGSLAKMSAVVPPSIHLIQNNAYYWQGVAVAGSRLWDSEEYRFSGYIAVQEGSRPLSTMPVASDEDKKIFARELGRLEMSLKAMDPRAQCRIVMTHYPPIGADMADSAVSALLEKYNVDICVFGHLHSIDPQWQGKLFGTKNGIRYVLASSDYIDHTPVHLLDLSSLNITS